MSKKSTLRENDNELRRLRKKYGVRRVFTRKNDGTATGNKKVKNAKTIVCGDITFKSGLEFFAYKKFQEAGIEVLYEMSTYVVLEPFKCGFPSYEQHGKSDRRAFKLINENVRAISYTPDFADLTRKEFIVECKGFSNEVFPIKLKLFKKLLTASGFKGTYYLPRNQKQVLQVIELIKQKRESRTENAKQLQIWPKED